jgi:hypothetical protein
MTARTPKPAEPAEPPLAVMDDAHDELQTLPAAEAAVAVAAGDGRWPTRADLPSPGEDPSLEAEPVSVVSFALGKVEVVSIAEARRLLAAHDGRLALPQDLHVAGLVGRRAEPDPDAE